MRYCFSAILIFVSINAMAMPAKIITAFHQLDQQAKILLNSGAKPVYSYQYVNQRLFQKSHFNQAAKALLPLAEKSNPLAQMELGFLYEFGHGVKQSYQTAAQWYYLAVVPYDYNEKPLVRALKAYYGLGEPINYQKAALWFRMAAELSVDKY